MNSRAIQLNKQVCFLCGKEITDNNCMATGGRLVHKQCRPKIYVFNGGINDKAGEGAKKYNEQYERRVKTDREFGKTNFVSTSTITNDDNTSGKINMPTDSTSSDTARIGAIPTITNGITIGNDGESSNNISNISETNDYVTGL
jgi:alkaline phosphatase